MTFGNPTDDDTRWQAIVGVVADTKRGGFEREPWAETYFPMRQAPTGRLLVAGEEAADETRSRARPAVTALCVGAWV